jgi:putative oxidoreductase
MKGDDVGRLLLRISVGGLMLLHGIGKLKNTANLPSLVAGTRIPGFVGYFSLIGEFVAPIMLLVGWGTRIAGPLVAFSMLTAVYLKHGAQVFQLGKSGGSAIELQLLYALGAIAIALIGPGALSLSKGKGRWA